VTPVHKLTQDAAPAASGLPVSEPASWVTETGKTMALTENGHRPEAATDAILSGSPLRRESYPSDAFSIPLVRHAVTEYARSAGAHGEQLEAIRLAVSEAVTNVVLYAYPWRVGHIYVTVRLAEGELWVLIADNGCGMHAGCESEGLGLGLAVIASVTDGFSIVERSSGGTELRLRFSLAEGGPDGRGRTRRPRRGYERGSVSSARRPAASSFSTTM
jgi:serine/threonine-protein kinase RsbW